MIEYWQFHMLKPNMTIDFEIRQMGQNLSSIITTFVCLVELTKCPEPQFHHPREGAKYAYPLGMF